MQQGWHGQTVCYMHVEFTITKGAEVHAIVHSEFVFYYTLLVFRNKINKNDFSKQLSVNILGQSKKNHKAIKAIFSRIYFNKGKTSHIIVKPLKIKNTTGTEFELSRFSSYLRFKYLSVVLQSSF